MLEDHVYTGKWWCHLSSEGKFGLFLRNIFLYNAKSYTEGMSVNPLAEPDMWYNPESLGE